MNTFCAASGRMAEEGIIVDTRNDTIINQKTIFRTHQAIAAFTRFQTAHHIGVEHVEKFACVRPFHYDLAER